MVQIRFFLALFLLAGGLTGAEVSLEPQDRGLFPSISASLDQLALSVQNFFSGPSEPKIQARLAINNELATQEIQFLHKRLEKVRKSLGNLLGKEIPFQATPRIGFCFSGGGVRAMVSAVGFLKKAEELRLFDTCLYTSALSGSTWGLGPWIASGEQTIAEYYPSLAPKLEYGLVFTNPELIVNMSEKWLAWFESGRTPSAIDIYGDLLANILLTEHNDQKFNLTLSQTHTADRFLSGDLPLPLYTAIMPKTEPYTLFEFSPFEYGSQISQCYIPPYALGAQFEDGVSSGKLDEPSLGYMLGVFGSAFDVSIEDLLRMHMQQVMGAIKELPEGMQAMMESALEHTDIGDMRFFPATVPNYSHNYGEHSLVDFKRLTFIDAGIDCNIPVLPLLHPERALDMLVIYDVSAGNDQFQTLQEVKAYTQAHNIPFPEIDYALLKEQSWAILHDDKNSQVPIVVYIALAKEEAYNPDFDPIESIKSGFCSTFNFKYTPDEIDLLAGLAGYRLEKLLDPILESIAQIVDKKQMARNGSAAPSIA